MDWHARRWPSGEQDNPLSSLSPGFVVKHRTGWYRNDSRVFSVVGGYC